MSVFVESLEGGGEMRSSSGAIQNVEPAPEAPDELFRHPDGVFVFSTTTAKPKSARQYAPSLLTSMFALEREREN